MLFNSPAFIFVFLPAVWTAAWLSTRISRGVTLRNIVLLAASLAFYGYWDIRFLPLLLASMAINYGASLLMVRSRYATAIMVATVAADLLCLGFFKYLLFFAETVLGPEEVPPFIRTIVLPIGISFFTFQQIAYLVDVWKGRIEVGDFLTYALFKSFFPQLIAGPVVRYQQIVPQLRAPAPDLHRFFAAGVFLFTVGLFKKVVLADNLADYANAVFARADISYSISLPDAWIGALSYTYQLYFDFSGYSDMALGLGLMFGFRLPLNFDSPYKATSIIDFWRRWHITLSNFFRDYVYIPLGGNRHGKLRQIAIIVLVMVLVGFWHGAGWTFIAWGAYHGILLALAHSLPLMPPVKRVLARWHVGAGQQSAGWRPHVARMAGWGLTFGLVVIGWVIFRAPNWEVAVKMIGGMMVPRLSAVALVYDARYLAAIALLLLSTAICLLLPNAARIAGLAVSTPTMFHDSDEAAPTARVPVWLRPSEGMSYRLAVVLAGAFYLATATLFTAPSQFLYFQF